MFQEEDRRFQIQDILSRTKDIGKKEGAVKKVAQTIVSINFLFTDNHATFYNVCNYLKKALYLFISGGITM